MTGQLNSIGGQFEAVVSRTFLPKCWSCGGVHPLAHTPPKDADTCPDCGIDALPPGMTQSTSNIIDSSGASLFVSKMLFSIGHKLNNFAKRI